MIDNFIQIGNLLDFDSPDDFYFVQIIQRKKDHKEGNKRLGRANNNRLIKAYYIISVEHLMDVKEEMIVLATQFNARVGITLNKRSFRFASFEMLELLAHSVKCNNFMSQRLWNTVCGLHYPKNDKYWIIDLDDVEAASPLMMAFIEACRPEGNKLVATIPTKSGIHLITKPFDLERFNKAYPDVEIHKNNPTILYIP